MISVLLKYKKDIFIVTGILIVAFFLHSYNMFHFPYYENDEGTYMSQARAVLYKNQLAPYTYFYDHAPLGWIQIALWIKIVGGFFVFGNAINTGRVFILLLKLLSILLLYLITKHFTNNVIFSALASLIYSVSPMGIFFQRRVLLDSIMTFWMLLSIWLVSQKTLTLYKIILSAVFFSIGVLSKETMIFLIPVYALIIHKNESISKKYRAIVIWVVISSFIISLYPFYALYKQEFFPTQGKPVSLVETLKKQSTRGSNLPFFNSKSDFAKQWSDWIMLDSFILLGGVISTIANLLIGSFYSKPKLYIPSLLIIFFGIFLMRGGLIFDFYIIPVIPLFALNIAVFINLLYLKDIKLYKFILTLLMVFVILEYYIYVNKRLSFFYVKDETKPQSEVVQWIINNIPNNSKIIIDSYAYVDLKYNDRFPNAVEYVKLIYDPMIAEQYGGKELKVDYILLTHNMLNDFRLISDNPVKTVFLNSQEIRKWQTSKSSTVVDVHNFYSSYGDWAMIYKVR